MDVTFQQIFNAKNLIRIAEIIGTEPDSSLKDEVAALTKIANTQMWDDATGLYHDLDREGKRVGVSHIGGFWALLADIVPHERKTQMMKRLFDPEYFAAPTGTRSLAKGERGYEPDGGNYWRGGVWCITDWAIVRGLDVQIIYVAVAKLEAGGHQHAGNCAAGFTHAAHAAAKG